MLLVFSITVQAQQDVTQFLGIPVDGSKSEMIRKLKEKGFRNHPDINDALIGEFNGRAVRIYVITNKDKVYRIMVSDAKTVDEGDIKIRFNNLCEQFRNNPKYISLEDYTIPEEEDVSYEMTVHNKRYQAVFYQQPTAIDTTIIDTATRDKIITDLLSKYTKEQLANPTEELRLELLNLALEYTMELYSKKQVWFIIVEFYGKYYIAMYYDNVYNRANGEDL